MNRVVVECGALHPAQGPSAAVVRAYSDGHDLDRDFPGI